MMRRDAVLALLVALPSRRRRARAAAAPAAAGADARRRRPAAAAALAGGAASASRAGDDARVAGVRRWRPHARRAHAEPAATSRRRSRGAARPRAPRPSCWSCATSTPWRPAAATTCCTGWSGTFPARPRACRPACPKATRPSRRAAAGPCRGRPPIACGRSARPGPNYRGPAAPASGPLHHYVFELYALDVWLDVPAVGQSPAATRAAVMAAMAGHVRGKGVLTGRYRRPAP